MKNHSEKHRLSESDTLKKKWKKWGPYLADRQWGTVREDYSANGDAWGNITHDSARSRAYRWGEEGIGGISDDRQLLCFALSFWNRKDPILKERFFGLTQNEGNHGEDVKENYYYLDNNPTHSYMKMLYKYPQSEFPYKKLVDENKRKSRLDPEYELIDTGIFDAGRYFDIFIEYAKNNENDILIKVTAHNRGNKIATIDLIPQIWFRNTWSWGLDNDKPLLSKSDQNSINIEHKKLGHYTLYCDGKPDLLFTDNETNVKKLYGIRNSLNHYKDGINDYIVNRDKNAINPNQTGTKAAARYQLNILPGKSETVCLRLTAIQLKKPFSNFNRIVTERIAEANEFYEELQAENNNPETRDIQRQALAGMLWSKQFYYFNISQWLKGDPSQPVPPKERLSGRNKEWLHLNNADIISMPDKWEYPWFAAWDLAFHCVTLAMVDPRFAKDQLKLLTREWYLHPNGQFPAYEWNFSDSNPPVHGWATWRVYKIDKKLNHGKGDTEFLESILHKLLLNFTWWVNRKDEENRNIFQGGFLGLDNIGVFDRSSEIPGGGHIEQADGTAWMAMYSLNLMRISLELAKTNPVYEDLATKFLEHFLYIAGAMANISGEGVDLWDDEDKFFYDVLHTENGRTKLKVRSMVGLIPLFAVEVIDEETLKSCPQFASRMSWFLSYRTDLASLVSRWNDEGTGETHLFSLLRGHRLKRILTRMLDETEFLSDYGVRALSRVHEQHPYIYVTEFHNHTVDYQPGESSTSMFGGNSNWRGPVWFPVNFLIIESLQRFHHYFGDDFKVECPTNSGRFLTLKEISDELSSRLIKIFLKDRNGRRPVFGENPLYHDDIHFKDYILFYEYFHGNNGRGVGASHQTGWTGLIAKLIQSKNQ
ncbi:MAG: hypothetical protein PHT07_00915 [Paludibacter sp.]|nr:hypothetical protein [Paludibacter sp.]